MTMMLKGEFCGIEVLAVLSASINCMVSYVAKCRRLDKEKSEDVVQMCISSTRA